MYTITKQDYETYYAIQEEYDIEYNELIDDLYHYMEAYINKRITDVTIFADCIENMLGIRKHEEIINYINSIL